MVWKACLACLEGLSGWLEGGRWLGGRLAVQSHTHDALGRSADMGLYRICRICCVFGGVMRLYINGQMDSEAIVGATQEVASLAGNNAPLHLGAARRDP